MNKEHIEDMIATTTCQTNMRRCYSALWMDLILGHCDDILQVKKTIVILSAAKIVPKIYENSGKSVNKAW